MSVLYMDYMKPFYMVPHRRLLTKLEHYGIGGKALDWIREFLSHRVQRVSIGNNDSDWRLVTSGIPQGSVLGPLLFVIYINDLPTNINSEVYMFADYTKVYSEIKMKMTLRNYKGIWTN